MTTPQPPRWYSVNNIGMATLCADNADAEDVARTCDIDFPRQAPHRAVQLVEVSELEKERTARQEAQQRLADLQEQVARSGLAHRLAVQRAVQMAVAEEREACAKLCQEKWEQLIAAWAKEPDSKSLPDGFTAYDCGKSIRARGIE